MNKAKRIFSIFLVILMLFTSLPMNVFAEEVISFSEENTMQEDTAATSEEEAVTEEADETTEETTEYEVGKEYTVNGVIYHTYDLYAVVKGAGENMPANVVISEKIGTFPVRKILAGAFDNCKELKSIVIPKYVYSIEGLKNTGLEKAEIQGSAIDIKYGAFRDCPLFENEENWENDLLIISGALIAGRGSEELYLGKEITSIAQGCFGPDSEIPRITFENLKFCYNTINSYTFGENTILRGRVGSDAERYANSFGNPFEYYCTCENPQFVEATKTYCNGTIGYSEGVWCESCELWLSGHEKNSVYNHMDENTDTICDYCGLSTDEKIIDSGALNQTVFWCMKEDGSILFYGTGKMTKPLSDSHKFVNIVIGGEINEIDAWAFAYLNYLESVVFGENVKTIGQSAFYDCPNLSRVEIEGKYVDIKSSAFGKTSFINDESNYKDGLLVVDGCLINCKKRGYVVLDKSIHSVALDSLYGSSRVVIENPDCVISSTGKPALSVMGLEGSTAEKFAKDNGLSFYRLCLCDDTLFAEGNPSLCDGTLNYKDGFWCEKCNTWKLGYGISSEIQHSDPLVKGVCTICGEVVPEDDKIIESGVIENGVWVLQNEDELVIYGTGEIGIPDDEQDYADWYNLKQEGKVKRIRIKGTVSKIGDSLFNGMETVESIKLENGITEIGASAFYGCKNLVNIELSNILISVGDSAFENCVKLQTPSFPDTLYKIGNRAFAECDSFESVVLPDNAEYIGDYAFAGCSKLTYVKLSKNGAKCGEYAFYNCFKLKTVDLAGFGTINEGTFEKCIALETVTTSKSSVYVGDYSFANCSALKDFPWEKVRSVGEEAFVKCTALTEVNLDCTGKVDDFAFQNCTNLKTVTMSARTDSFGVGVFQGCTALEDVSLSTGLTEIPKQMFKGCKAIKKLEIPSNITTIGIAAFRACTGLTEIVLEENISQIKVKAFYGCSNLKKLTFLNNDVEIAGVYREDGKNYPSIPKTTVISSSVGSKAHEFALVNGYSFVGLDASEKPVRAEVITQPTKTKYYVSDKATKIDTSGVVLRIYFENESYLDLTSGFTVNAKDTDLTKVGIYNPVLVYEGLEAVFTVTVEEVNPDTPTEEKKTLDFVEGSILEVDCSVYDTIRFVPEETREYYFVFEDANTVTLTMTDGTVKSFFKDSFHYSFVAGELYLITFTQSAYIKTMTLRETDIFDSEVLPDGTLQIRKYLGAEKNPEIPSVIGDRIVTEIGEDLFYSWNSLTSIKVPSTVKVIHNNAFTYCRNLTEIDLSKAISLEYIGEGAFKYCDSLKEITLPSSVKEIGAEAFEGCDQLETVVFGVNDITFGGQIFYGCKKLKNVTLPEKLTAISDWMFSNCTSLTEIKLNGGLKKIGEHAFASCTGLKKIVLPDSIEEIDERAFKSCEGIKEVVIPEKITSISKYSFYGCKSLEKVRIKGENVTIGEDAFAWCSTLKEITFENSVSEIGMWAFSYCKALESIDFGNNLAKIGTYAFENCTALKEVILPETITELGSSMFSGCTALEKVSILGDITSIGYSCFKDCTSLKTINIPKSVIKIGDGAFENANINIDCLAFDNPVEIGKNAFKNCTEIISVVIPENSTVGVSAFEGNKKITQASVGKNSTICGSAFKGCLRLEEFEITEGTTILADALDDCRSLRKITILNPMMPGSSLGSLPLNVKIYAIKDSYGEKFANENHYEFFEIQGHAHSFTIETVGEKRCYTSGKEIYTCKCGYSYEKAISSTKHKYKDFVVEKEPTCTDPGLKTRHCYCGRTRSEITVIEPLGHVEIIDIPAVAPTATEPGYTHQSHCSVCGETVVKRELIGHGEYDIRINDDNVTAQKFDAATNENDGAYITITFELKNQVYLSYIDKTVIYKVGEVKLSKTSFDYNGKVQKPGVTVKDSTGEPLVLNRDYRITYSADSKYCGEYSVKVDYIGNYAGNKTLYYDIVHNWDAGKITKSPICTKTGTKTFTCGCGASYSETVAKLGHSYSNACDTTCNRSGCGVKRSITHSYKNVTVKATLTKNGSTRNKCSVCGKASNATTIYYPKTFTLSTTAYTYNGEVKTPSVTVKDSKGNSLKRNIDYTVSYESGRKAPGKYTVKITFKGKYEGTKRLYFTIAPKVTSKITASQTTTAITLKWNKVTGADSYRVYQYNAKTKKWVKVKDVTGKSLKISKLKAGTAYKYKVRAYTKDDGTIYGDYSKVFETVTKCETPSITKLTTTKGKASFTWSNVSGESGYQVYYSTKKDSGYKKADSYKVNVTKGSKTKLKSGKKYYFKVRAYKKVDGKTVYGSFSSVKSIKIK